jgi:hypothetical protein
VSEQKDNWSEPIVWDDLTPREVPVKLGGDDYVLVEATAEEAKAWRANNMQSLQMEETGKGKNRKSKSAFNSRIADSHILLVSLCLRKIEGGVRLRVPADKIRTWRNPVVEELFKRAQQISELDEEDDDESDEDHAKNSSGVSLSDTSADTP